MLEGITVSDEVRRLRPDYVVLVVAVDGLPAGPSNGYTRGLLEESARGAGGVEHPHVTAWHDAFRAFGAKPNRTRPSVDALLRRLADPPGVNAVVDVYNAVSIRHVVPVGGEDLDAYRGPARLVRARGDERFDTVAAGQVVQDPPQPGEVVWRDDEGVTCRCWNWRQCVRTRIGETSRRGLFIFDRLAPYPIESLQAAGAELVAHLTRLSPEARVETRLIAGD